MNIDIKINDFWCGIIVATIVGWITRAVYYAIF